MNYIDNLNAINDRVQQPEILAQLAEEATELAHAALKLRRVLDGANPTDVGLEEAVANLVEEYADVELCWELVDVQYTRSKYLEDLMEHKAERWVDRLHRKEMHNDHN